MATVPAVKSAWQPTIPVNQSIYEGSTTQKAPLGTRLEVGDRVFHYAKVATTQAAGMLCCAPLLRDSDLADLVTAAGTKGDKYVVITAATNVASAAFNEGYMIISSGTAGKQGFTYRVSHHGSIASAGTGTIYLYDQLVDSISSAADEVNFLANIYNGVHSATSTGTDLPVGFTPCQVTSAGYCWLQTWGIGAAEHEAATAAAVALKPGTIGGVVVFSAGGTTGGCVAANAVIIGKNINAAATQTESNPIMITIRG